MPLAIHATVNQVRNRAAIAVTVTVQQRDASVCRPRFGANASALANLMKT